MGWEEKISSYLPEDVSVPAVGQGALGIECRAEDTQVLELLALLNDNDSALTVRAERSFLGALNGGCQIPIGAHAILLQSNDEKASEQLELTGIVGLPDGSILLKETLQGNNPEELGIALADALKAQGAERILIEFGG